MFEDGRIWNWKPEGLEEAARRAEKAWQDSLALFEAGIEIGRKLEAAQRAEKEGKA